MPSGSMVPNAKIPRSIPFFVLKMPAKDLELGAVERISIVLEDIRRAAGSANPACGNCLRDVLCFTMPPLLLIG
jgi:hypothetical protein